MYDRFGVVAVIVLPDVGNSGESRRRRWGQNGWYRVRLWRLQYLFLHITFRLGTMEGQR